MTQLEWDDGSPLSEEDLKAIEEARKEKEAGLLISEEDAGI